MLVSYSKSSSTKGWHSNEFGIWNAEPLTITGGNSNSLFPSSDKDSYPFDELFIELNGYTSKGKKTPSTVIIIPKKNINGTSILPILHLKYKIKY